MSSLKQEMRQMFERHSSMSFYENNTGFDEGLLEQIINLTYANLLPYSSARWSILAVKSPVLLQKLYRLTEEKRIPDSAVALIICRPALTAPEPGGYAADVAAAEQQSGQGRYAAGVVSAEQQSGQDREWTPSCLQRDLELLSLSIAYAAKYYCIESFVMQSFDPEAVAREFALDRQKPAAAIIGLGHYRNHCPSYPQIKNLYSETVKIL